MKHAEMRAPGGDDGSGADPVDSWADSHSSGEPPQVHQYLELRDALAISGYRAAR